MHHMKIDDDVLVKLLHFIGHYYWALCHKIHLIFIDILIIVGLEMFRFLRVSSISISRAVNCGRSRYIHSQFMEKHFEIVRKRFILNILRN